jgi:hypothetical protein
MASDRATQLLLRRAKSFKGLVSQPAWGDMKEQLMEDLATLIDLRNIKDDENVAFRVSVRREAYRILSNWVNELETKASLAPKPVIPRDYIFNTEKQ